jgi:hypothetical protein
MQKARSCDQAFNAERTGLEPATSYVTGRRSNQLNYRSIEIKDFRGPKGSRTPDLLNAIQALYQLSYGPFIQLSIDKCQKARGKRDISATGFP